MANQDVESVLMKEGSKPEKEENDSPLKTCVSVVLINEKNWEFIVNNV